MLLHRYYWLLLLLPLLPLLPQLPLSLRGTEDVSHELWERAGERSLDLMDYTKGQLC